MSNKPFKSKILDETLQRIIFDTENHTITNYEAYNQIISWAKSKVPDKRFKRNGESTTNIATAEWGWNEVIDETLKNLE